MVNNGTVVCMENLAGRDSGVRRGDGWQTAGYTAGRRVLYVWRYLADRDRDRLCDYSSYGRGVVERSGLHVPHRQAQRLCVRGDCRRHCGVQNKNVHFWSKCLQGGRWHHVHTYLLQRIPSTGSRHVVPTVCTVYY